jgi:hypothetical protein
MRSQHNLDTLSASDKKSFMRRVGGKHDRIPCTSIHPFEDQKKRRHLDRAGAFGLCGPDDIIPPLRKHEGLRRGDGPRNWQRTGPIRIWRQLVDVKLLGKRPDRIPI